MSYDHMIHVHEPQWSEPDPKLFSNSSMMYIVTLSKFRWTEPHYPLLVGMLARLIMTKELVQ
jgi:hypothetical protein